MLNELKSWSLSLFVALIVLIQVMLVLSMSGCGSESSGNNENSDSEKQEKGVVTSSPDIDSIALESKSELPECVKENESQLAYVIDEDQFYVCKSSWKVVSIKGKQGDKGEKGDSGSTVIRDSNNSNYWTDSITGYQWFLGGTATKANALITCTGDYRLPTLEEGKTAVNHGIRLIAADIGANADFWSSSFNLAGVPQFVTLNAGNAEGSDGTSVMTKSVFCVK